MTGPVFDTRVRPPFGSFATTKMVASPDASEYALRNLSVPGSIADGPDYDRFLVELGDAGVTRALVAGRLGTFPGLGEVSPENDDILALLDADPDLYCAAVAVDCDLPHQALGALRSVLRPGIVGVIVEPGFAQTPRCLDDPFLDPIWEACEELSIPALVLAGGICGPDLSYSDPLHLDRLAARRPDVTFVAVKGGYPYVLQALHCAFRRPNVWISPDLWACHMPGASHFAEAANTFLGDRLLFGSAYPHVEVGEAVRAWRALGFDERVRDKVLFENAARLFG